MSKSANVWRPITAERHGSFVNIDYGLRKTCDVNSSVDVLAWNMKDSVTAILPSNRFRDFIYRRINNKDNTQSVLVWTEKNDIFQSTFAFDEVYYLPFHKCFIAFHNKKVSLFDADPYKVDGWYLYVEPCEKCFVFGKFIMYSENGTDFGLYDSELHRKIPPFFRFDKYEQPWNTELFHSWTDDFFPVVADGYYFLMDHHGTCFCRETYGIKRFENAFQGSDKTIYVFNEETKVPMELKSTRYISKLFEIAGTKKLAIKENDYQKYYFDAFGNWTDMVDIYVFSNGTTNKSFSYYGEIIESSLVNSYFKTPLALPHKLGNRLHTCFFEVSNNGKVGIFNEETNEVVAEPIYDEVKCSGDGFRLTYGYKYIYLDELGNFLTEREGQ